MANLVVALLGQSNAQGHGLNTEIPAATAAEVAALGGAVRLYVGAGTADAAVTGAWINLRDSTGYDIDHFGAEIALGLELRRAYPADTIWIIKHGSGSTNLYSDWKPPGGGTWAAAAATIAAALVGVAAPVPIGAVWIQGESDTNAAAGPANAAAYGANLLLWIDAVRAAFSTPKLPVVVSALSEALAGTCVWTQRVRAGQYAATRRRPLVWTVDPTGLPWSGGVHYTAAGLLSLGAKLAAPLQGRTSRPIVAAPGRTIEHRTHTVSALGYSNTLTIADHEDVRPRNGDWCLGLWARQLPHAGQVLWISKATGGTWYPIYQDGANRLASYMHDGANFCIANTPAPEGPKDRWAFYWSRCDRTRGKLELWRDLDLLADVDIGAVADVNPTGALALGGVTLVQGDFRFNDLIWRKGGCWSWDDVRRYLSRGIPIPDGGTKQIRWQASEGAGATVVSSPAGYNGTIAAGTWTTLTRSKARPVL